MAENLVKIVSIIESSVNNSEQSAANDVETDEVQAAAATTAAVTAPAKRISRTHSSKSQNEEIFLRGPTLSGRLMRYLVVVVYLCGLCSLGFFLSVYHIFIWDSRMPPVYKAAPTKKPLFVKY